MRHARGRFGVIGLVLALALGPAAAASSATARTLDNPNWSGYAAVACGSCAFRYVAATWKLSAVNCAASPLPVAWDDSWVGLDGLTSGSVEQVGTSAVCTNGQASYFAWWEMYPARPVIPRPPGDTPAMRPGDQITASVYYDSATRRWLLTLDDPAARLVISTWQPCPAGIECDNADAEVITEAPNAGATVPLADFGSTAYSSIRVTSRNGTRGSMASTGLWTVHPVNLVGLTTGHLLASPGPTTGEAFTDTWRAAQ